MSLLYDIGCGSTNASGLYSVEEIITDKNVSHGEETFQTQYFRKNEHKYKDLINYVDNDYDSISLKSREYSDYSGYAHMKQLMVHHCISLIMNKEYFDINSAVLTATETLKLINLPHQKVIVASMDIEGSLLNGNTEIWEVSLNEHKVYINNIFSGIVEKIEDRSLN